MSQNIWDDETENFNDMPDEVHVDSNGRQLEAPPVSMPRQTRPSQPTPPPVQEEVEVDYEAVEEFSTEEEFEDVLSDAHLRLEQGSLYKLIINHSLFDGVDADPKAIQNVQKEIRQFAKERMEVMLGMRKDTSVVEHLEIDFPFNAVEVKVLKMIAHKASGGASEESDKFVPEVRRTTSEVQNVGAGPLLKKRSLNPIGTAVAKRQAAPAPARKPLATKPSAPVPRYKAELDETIDKIAREEGVPRELLEENIPGVGGKPLSKLSEQELLERNRLTSKRRGTQVKSTTALPMPTYEQQAMMAEQAAAKASNVPAMSTLIGLAKNMPIKSK